MRPSVKSWRWLSAMAVSVLLLVSLVPIPVSEITQDGGDKLLHGLSYALLMMIFSLSWHRPRARWVAVVFSLALGALIEGAHWWLPYRTAEWLDLLANAIGTMSGTLLGAIIPVSWFCRSNEPPPGNDSF